MEVRAHGNGRHRRMGREAHVGGWYHLVDVLCSMWGYGLCIVLGILTYVFETDVFWDHETVMYDVMGGCPKSYVVVLNNLRVIYVLIILLVLLLSPSMRYISFKIQELMLKLIK